MKWAPLGALAFAARLRGTWDPADEIENFRFVDDLEPVAPTQDGYRIAHPREIGGVVRLNPHAFVPHDAFPTAFPPQGAYPTAAPTPIGRVLCFNAVNWKDSFGNTCGRYKALKLCTAEKKQGTGWKDEMGPIAEAGSPSGIEACCDCGGGARQTVIGPPVPPTEMRHLHPHGDRYPIEAYAHSRGPRLHTDNPKMLAPGDRLPNYFTRYLHQFRRRANAFSPSGLTTQFFVAAPEDWAGDWGAQQASALTGFINYNNALGRPLKWPGKGKPSPWFVRWTGTITIISPGEYRFNLVLSSAKSRSRVVIGESEIVTAGQCAARKVQGDCTLEGCQWSEDSCLPQADIPLFLDGKGFCVDIVVEMQDAAQLIRLEYQGPDSGGSWATIPSPVLSCNPIVPGCTNPREDACTPKEQEEQAVP